MRKLLFVSLLVFILFAQAAFATDFSIAIDGEESYRAGAEEVATLSITNSGAGEWFSVSIIGSNSDWVVPDTSSGNIKVPIGEIGTLDIFITPGKDAIPITYEYTVSVTKLKSDTSKNEKIEKILLVQVVQVTDLIVGEFELSCYECDKEITVTGALYNVGTRDVPAKLTLSFGDDERIIEVAELKAWEEEAFAETFDLTNLPPKAYEITAKITSKQALMFSDVREFRIPQIEDISFEEKSFTTPFGRFVSIEANNEANYKTEVTFESEVQKAWYILYSGPEPVSEGDVNTWVVTLDAEEDYTLGYNEIYWPTYVFVILILIFGFILYLNYTAVTLSKAIVGKNIVKPGKEMSVSITVKNKIRTLSNLIVKDIIPEGFGLVTKFDTIKPTLRKTHSGIEVIWKIGDLKPHEQRVLHYKIKPIKMFKGRKHLPKASLIAKFAEKTIKKVSNLVSIYTEGNEPSIVPVDISK
ncbi:MAG: hypothetical protein KJ906_02090 [Nanoarchaeota archaeon]|nr:hypothetical protein [Nanoarchaeota archaeon]